MYLLTELPTRGCFQLAHSFLSRRDARELLCASFPMSVVMSQTQMKDPVHGNRQGHLCPKLGK
eukprot:2737567-Karenia_brevis.AAC.1